MQTDRLSWVSFLGLAASLLGACGDSGSGGAGGAGTTASGTTTASTTAASSTTGSTTSSGVGGAAAAFTVKSVSGADVVLNRTWDRGCLQLGPGDWSHDERTLTGLVLVTTITEYLNGSTTPDCTTGLANTTTFTQVLTNDQIPIPITWVDPSNNPASAPAGLEGVMTANGASGLMTVATRTPNSQAGADALNVGDPCGLTGWQTGVTKDVMACFTGGVNPGKGTIVVDDRTMPWKVYDGVGNDPSAYPTFMPDFAPHTGPFH